MLFGLIVVEPYQEAATVPASFEPVPAGGGEPSSPAAAPALHCKTEFAGPRAQLLEIAGMLDEALIIQSACSK